MHIWQKLKQNSLKIGKPIFALAPMEDVTDTVFRQVIIKTGRPDIFYTEFMSVEGFMSEKGRSKVAKRLIYTPAEKPLIAQIWGITPSSYEQTAKELVKLGFDGIDINLGCPQKKIVKTGGCAKLIGNYVLTKEIIEATKQGTQGEIPVSVKTRLGFNENIINEWGNFLLEQDLAELTIHGRIAKEMSITPAKWEEIAKVVAMRDSLKKKTLILGNGDVFSYTEGIEKAHKTNVDGIMVGRGIFRNPWFFDPISTKDSQDKSKEEKLAILKFHVDLYEKTWGNKKKMQNLRHYFKIYLHGFDGASSLREKLMECQTYQELRDSIKA
jgi:nifR3 family TIM-barrel protein